MAALAAHVGFECAHLPRIRRAHWKTLLRDTVLVTHVDDMLFREPQRRRVERRVRAFDDQVVLCTADFTRRARDRMAIAGETAEYRDGVVGFAKLAVGMTERTHFDERLAADPCNEIEQMHADVENDAALRIVEAPRFARWIRRAALEGNFREPP